MKKKMMQKALALVLASATALSLCACGGNGGSASGKKSEEKFYKTTYVELPESFGENMYYSVMKDNKIYYGGSNSDYTRSSIRVYDIETKEDKLIWESEEYGYETGRSIDINGLYVNSDGNVLVRISESKLVDDGTDYSATTYEDVMNFFVENWGYEYNDAVKEWNEWYSEYYLDDNGNPDYGKFLQNMNSEWTYTSSLVLYSGEGAELWNKPADVNSEDGVNSYVGSVVLTDDDQLVMMVNEWDDSRDEYFFDVYDKNGDKTNRIKLDGYADSMFLLHDGNLAYSSWGDTSYEYRTVDLKSGKVSEGSNFVSGTPYVQDKSHLLIKGDSGLMSFDLNSKEATKLFSWIDVEISSSSVNSVVANKDGSITALIRNYSNVDQKYVTELAIIEEATAADFEGVTFLTYACMYMDYDVEARILEFNRKHNDVKIKALTFDSGSDWETNYNQFVTALSTNNNIDLVSFNYYNQVLNMAAKGNLIDLREVFDKAGDLTEDQILPGVLKACEVDGKIVMLPTGFTLSTMVAKTDIVGSEMGWTLDQAKAIWDSMPAGTEFSTATTRSEMMNNLISLNYGQFVNTSKGTCDFDNEEFVKLLEFTAKFPEEINWDSYEYDDDRFVNNQVICNTCYLSEFYDMQFLPVQFGGDVTMIGYPSSETNGAYFSFNSMYGITKNCENPTAAWEFLSQFYANNTSSSNAEGDVAYSNESYGFSIRKDAFEQKCKAAMDPNNSYVGETWGWGNYEYTVHATTQEEVDQVTNLINGTTAVYGAASDAVINLIMEEANYYYSGERSAEEVAKKVQSRMSIYLSETN